jgi:hypothetical protein
MEKTEIEIEIVEVLPDDSEAGISKGTSGYNYRFIYRLADGTLEPTVGSKRLLREAKSFISSLPKVPENLTIAIYHDGRFVGTRVTFKIGGGSRTRI